MVAAKAVDLKAEPGAAPKGTELGVLKYQYEQIIKHLMLLQDHAAARTCPYSPAGEMCIRKHLLTIEAYAQETVPMEDNPTFKKKLEDLGAEASNYRLDQEAILCGEKEESLEGLDHWARKWRKDLELHALTCELQKSAEELPQLSER